MKNNVVILTGAEGGIGKEIFKTLTNDCGFHVVRFEGDVRFDGHWEAFDDTINDLKRKTWAVVNCAGIATAKTLFELNTDDFYEMFQTNCLSIFHSIKRFSKYMRARANKEGKITGHFVNITSISSLQGTSYLAHYCASKFAANGLMQVAAKELAPYGILINNVCPGPTETPMWKSLDEQYSLINGWKKGKPWNKKYYGKQLIKRLGKPKDVASVVKFLISSENTFITGTNIPVCGGNIIR